MNSEERMSFLDRTKVDLVLALAVIHHLAISKNIPFELISKLFSMLGSTLIVEFVPKEDEKIKLMLEGRKDVFFDYSEDNFLKSFMLYYKLIASEMIGTTGRKLYLMERL